MVKKSFNWFEMENQENLWYLNLVLYKSILWLFMMFEQKEFKHRYAIIEKTASLSDFRKNCSSLLIIARP